MKIMIMAAGTGGHVFPGIALAEEFKKQAVDICWLGSVGGMEKPWVEKAKIPFQAIKIKGLRGNGLLGWLTAPINIIKAILQAKKIIKQLQPDLVLGMGGFVCGPGGVAAKILGIKLVLHEQNAIPGLTNKLLSKISNLVITAFPQDKIKNTLQLGNPVRQGLEQVPVLSNSNDKFNLLIIGGSRGALAINRVMPEVLKLLEGQKNIHIVHQTGTKTLAETKEFYQQQGLNTEQDQCQIVDFIDDMVSAYQQADLVICRSGALTVSELIAAARPAIMIPFPFAVDDHQSANAQVLVNLGGGGIIQQIQLNPTLLAKEINYWLDNDRNILASNSIRKQSKKNATQEIVIQIIKIISDR